MLPSRHGRRRLRPAVAGATLLLGAALAVPSHADEQPAPPPQAQADEHAAEQALENAQAALAGDSGLEPTLALAELVTVVDDLKGRDLRAAEALLARPDDDGGDQFPGGLAYGDASVDALCGEHTCVHHATTGHHQPPATDGNGDGTPDWVEMTLRTIERVWRVEVGELGHRQPVGDAKLANPPGETRDDLLDVYLGDLGGGDYPVFGYAVPETQDGQSYLVLDDDFADFGVSTFSKRRGLLRVTAAHEFFHAVQYAHDVGEDGWFLETTATWIEDEVFDAVDDNRYYLSESAMQLPGRPLNSHAGLTWYGNWIFFRHATERHGVDLVRQMWEQAARPTVQSLAAVDRALRAHRTSLADEFADFSVANNAPRRFYEEGRAYVRAPLAGRWTLSTDRRGTGRQEARLQHLASRNLAFRPGRSLTGRWQLRVRVDGPDRAGEARVLVHRTDGRVSRRVVRLNRYGNGTIRVAFRRTGVRKVTLNVANVHRLHDRRFRVWARAVR